MIHPQTSDRNRPVRFRHYTAENGRIVGSWVEGRIKSVGPMLVVVGVGDAEMGFNRADLDWVEKEMK